MLAEIHDMPHAPPSPSRFASAVRLSLAILTLQAGAAALRPVEAAQWPHLTLKQLCDLSDDIVRAEVLSQECFRAANGWIFTRYELQVLDRALPASGGEPLMTIEQPGGELDGFWQTVGGIQHFTVGEELVLFTGTAANGRRVALAGPRGAQRVIDGELPGVAAAFPELDTRDAAGFLARVRQLLAESSGPRNGAR